LKTASTAVLLAGLGHQLKHIQTNADHAQVARDSAARVILELGERNEK